MRLQKRLFESTVSSSRLQERVLGVVGEGKVDKENYIIRDVKLLGRQSVNGEHGRVYEQSAIEAAKKHYEGARVRIDHRSPDAPMDRPFLDECGFVEGIYEAADGLYAKKFVLYKSHPLATLIIERAEKRPDKFGFSHEADGVLEIGDDGVERVVDLLDVESIDLVSRPATNQSLWESDRRTREVSKMKITILESFRRAPLKYRKGLLEMAGEMSDETAMMEVEVPADASPEEILLESIPAAIQAIIADGNLDDSAKLAAIVELLSQSEPAPVTEEEGSETEEPVMEEENPVEEPVQEQEPATLDTAPAETKVMQEAIQRAVKAAVAPLQKEVASLKEGVAASDRTQRAVQVRSEVEAIAVSHGVTLTESQLSRACSMKASDRKEYIGELAQLRESHNPIRSSGRVTESVGSIDSYDDYVAALSRN